MDTSTCPLCQSTDHNSLKKGLRDSNKHSVIECQKCKLVFIDPIPKKEELLDFNVKGSQDRLTYSDVDDHHQYQMGIIDAKRRYRWISKKIGNGCRIFEIGPGYGNFLELAKKDGFEALGLELSLRKADYCKDKLGLDVITDPLEKIIDGIGKFDAICMFHVLEHLQDPVMFLNTLKKILRPNGKIFIEVPNRRDFMLSLSKPYFEFYFQLSHILYFDANTLGRLLDQANLSFRINTIQRYGIRNHLSWILKGKPQLNIPNLIDRKIINFNTMYSTFLETSSLGDTLCVECYSR